MCTDAAAKATDTITYYNAPQSVCYLNFIYLNTVQSVDDPIHSHQFNDDINYAFW
jgi:hypothetical protein